MHDEHFLSTGYRGSLRDHGPKLVGRPADDRFELGSLTFFERTKERSGTRNPPRTGRPGDRSTETIGGPEGVTAAVWVGQSVVDRGVIVPAMSERELGIVDEGPDRADLGGQEAFDRGWGATPSQSSCDLQSSHAGGAKRRPRTLVIGGEIRRPTRWGMTEERDGVEGPAADSRMAGMSSMGKAWATGQHARGTEDGNVHPAGYGSLYRDA